MLVDLDLVKELRYKVLMERIGFVFFVEIEYERLLNYALYVVVFIIL